MSYTAVTIPNLLEGESGYRLDTGDYVAVSKRPQLPERCQSNHVSFVWKARWVDAQGAAKDDYAGNPVEWEHVYSALQSAFVSNAITAQQYAQTGLDLVIQGGADGAPADELHPDLGVRAKISAVKSMLSMLA